MNKKVLFVGLLAGCFGMNAFAATEIYVSASTDFFCFFFF